MLNSRRRLTSESTTGGGGSWTNLASSSPFQTSSASTTPNANASTTRSVRNGHTSTRQPLVPPRDIERHAHQTIAAIIESRGVSAQVGLCFLNESTCECILSELSDSQTYVRTMQKLHVFEPYEILMPDTKRLEKSTLLNIIKENCRDANIQAIPKQNFKEQIGLEYVDRLSFREDASALGAAVSGKVFSLAAAGALLKYVATSKRTTFPNHSLRFRYQGSEGSMLVDSSTVKSLELVRNACSQQSTDSLYGLLNHTLTPMGGRFLRTNILQPSTDVQKLQTRLDAIDELIQNPDMFASVREALKAFHDMDRLLAALVNGSSASPLKFSEQSINNIIMLKQEISSVQPLYDSLRPASSVLLTRIRNLCDFDYVESAQEMIDNVINKDVVWANSAVDLRNQRMYAVKSNVNGLLDVTRQVFKESTEEVYESIRDLSEKHNLPLDLRFESQRGYFIRLPTVELEDKILPPIFININKKKKYTEFSTLELVKWNKRIGDTFTEVLLSSDTIIQKLVEDVRTELSALYKISESVAELNMLASFADLAATQDYVRPQFTDTFAIKDGRHPIREKIHKEKFVPNDVYASEQSRFQVITGCNMSGKSTYIRQIALLVIMAQVGSLVPATYASLPIIHQVFARTSTDDNLTANASTFAVEMREIAFILRNIDEGSLVIIDELGRGTSTRDGLAIALSISEKLIQSLAFVWFATHFRELACVMAEHVGAVNLHMQVEMINEVNSMSMLYKVDDGAEKEEHYGLALARTMNIDSTIIDRATIVSMTLQQNTDQKKMKSKEYALARKRKLFLLLHEQLKQAQRSHMTSHALYSWLSKLRDDFIERISELQTIIETCEDEDREVSTMDASEGSTSIDEWVMSSEQPEESDMNLSQLTSER